MESTTHALESHPVGPICAPNHWSMWNTFTTLPPWQLHVPHTKASPLPNFECTTPRFDLNDSKQRLTEIVDQSPIYVLDSPSPQHSVITISSSSDEGDHDDQGLGCSLLVTSQTKIEAPSPETEAATVMYSTAMQTPSPVYPNLVPCSIPHYGHQSHVKTSPQRSLVPHSITSLIQPKTSPGNHMLCCRQPQTTIGEVPANLCYLHVPVTVARMDSSTPDNASLGSPCHNGQLNHLYPFRRQGISGFVPQLPSSQTAFSPVCAVVTSAPVSSPSRLQLLHPCFLSPASNSYAQNSVIYPHMQATAQLSTSHDPCSQGGYLMTPTIGGMSQPHSCNSMVTDNGLIRMTRHNQMQPSPYSAAQLSPQQRIHHLGYPGSMMNHTGYQPMEQSSAYLAYTYYGGQQRP